MEDRHGPTSLANHQNIRPDKDERDDCIQSQQEYVMLPEHTRYDSTTMTPMETALCEYARLLASPGTCPPRALAKMTQVICSLLVTGADPNCTVQQQWHDRRQCTLNETITTTGLHLAVCKPYNPTLAKFLLDGGCRVDATDTFGITPLVQFMHRKNTVLEKDTVEELRALWSSHCTDSSSSDITLEMLRLLLNARADPNQLRPVGREETCCCSKLREENFPTPLLVLGVRRGPSFSDMLLRYGANVNCTHLLMPVVSHVILKGHPALGRLTILEQLLTSKQQLDLDYCHSDGQTVLHDLSRMTGEDGPAVARMLVTHRPDVLKHLNTPSQNGQVPLHRAVALGKFETALLWLEHGAAVNIVIPRPSEKKPNTTVLYKALTAPAKKQTSSHFRLILEAILNQGPFVQKILPWCRGPRRPGACGAGLINDRQLGCEGSVYPAALHSISSQTMVTDSSNPPDVHQLRPSRTSIS